MTYYLISSSTCVGITVAPTRFSNRRLFLWPGFSTDFSRYSLVSFNAATAVEAIVANTARADKPYMMTER
jgi:hypothetical protein